MFNLFKKATTVNGKYPSVVDKIHNEFNTPGDKILEEANAVLEKCKESDIQKGQRLKKLGFVETKQAKQSEETIVMNDAAMEKATLVRYYREKYPLNKFITNEQVKAICDKYNLVRGDISLYTGFVPERELAKIEKFRIKAEDNDPIQLYEIKSVKYKFYTTNMTKSAVEKIISDNNSILPAFQHSSYNEAAKFFPKYYTEIEGIDYDKLVTSEYEICAPMSEMNTKGMKLKGKTLIKSITTKFSTTPDPVVLKAVKGGALIIAAWGDESSDPIVVNEINN